MCVYACVVLIERQGGGGSPAIAIIIVTLFLLHSHRGDPDCAPCSAVVVVVVHIIQPALISRRRYAIPIWLYTLSASKMRLGAQCPEMMMAMMMMMRVTNPKKKKKKRPGENGKNLVHFQGSR